MTGATTDSLAPGAARPAACDPLEEVSGRVAAAFKRKWGRGPAKTTAHWAGANMVVVLLHNGHTPAEKTMRAAGHVRQLFEGRRLLQDTLEDELKSIVGEVTGREVLTMLSATRLDPDISAEIFLLEDARPAAGVGESLGRAARAAQTRAGELQEETRAVHAQSERVRAQAARRRDDT